MKLLHRNRRSKRGSSLPMVMAIGADKLGKPLNELRFISIREVTES